MLDISRGRVPRLETLLELVGHLADFKINEFQLYTEHTFAYRKYQSVWQNWGALTGDEIRRLDARCRNWALSWCRTKIPSATCDKFWSIPGLKSWPRFPHLTPTTAANFVRRPSTLAPKHPGTLPFLRGLYDELLPNFSSRFFNVGCDETWDLGRGQSKKLCVTKGQGRVYLDFLKQIHREVSARGKQMMFWGDIILKYPKLIPNWLRLERRSPPGPNGERQRCRRPRSIIALNWGYEAEHPFAREAALLAKAKIPFYVCPGTSTWQTLMAGMTTPWPTCAPPPKPGASTAPWVISSPIGATAAIPSRSRSVIFPAWPAHR